MDLSIIIVNWNTRDLLARCLTSLYEQPPDCQFDVWVVDNASGDGSAQMVRTSFPQVQVVANSQNSGFARANNQAICQSVARYVLLLNPDTLVHAGAVNALYQHIKADTGLGAVGPKLLNADGTLQVSVYPAPTLGSEFWRLFHLDGLVPVSCYPHAALEKLDPRPVDVIMGACLMVRRAVLDQVGLFDTDYFVYSEEVDLCERIRKAGYRLMWLPAAQVTHYGGRSTSQVADAMFLELYRNKLRFFRKQRGKTNAWLYKYLLYVAAAARISSAMIAKTLRLPLDPNAQELTHQYRLLLEHLRELSR